MRVHILGVPHTITHPRFSHDAFTNKVRYFAPMMRPLGYEVVHYGVEGSHSGATQDVNLLTEDEFYGLLGHRLEDKQRMHVADANTGNPLYREFNARLRVALAREVRRGDVVFHSLGTGHQASLGSHVGVNCELGIGYPASYLPFRIFESSMWMHYHQAKFQRDISSYEWVIPPYFEESEWPMTRTPDTNRPYCAFLGRVSHTKGCHLIVEIAKRMPEMRFVLCGQGDPTPFLVVPNIEYKEPIHGIERAEYLGKATACLYPSQYAEPGGHGAIEAMHCGTPALTPTYGCFVETVTHGVTGWQCRVLNDWVRAIELSREMNRTAIAIEARRRFSLPAIAPLYADAIDTLSGYGMGQDWYNYPARF